MRMLIQVTIPNEAFNTAVRNGSVGQTMERILSETKPEAVYFTEYDGKRGAIMIVDIADPSKIPALCEPWFLSFNAEVSRHLVMSPEDLRKAGLDALGQTCG